MSAEWSFEQKFFAFWIFVGSFTSLFIAHKICASIVWSVKSLVLVALPWVVGFVRGLLSLGGGFQSSRCGLVLPEDAGIAHRSRCDGENWGAGLLRAWSQPWGGWVWLLAAILAATLCRSLALACTPPLRKALNVVGRFLSPETVRELAGKEAQLAAARASEGRLQALLESSNHKLHSGASTYQELEGRLDERERSLWYYQDRVSQQDKELNRLRFAGLEDERELRALRGKLGRQSDAHANSERAASEALEALKGELEGVRLQLATTEQAAQIELGHRAAAEAALAEWKAASPDSTAAQTMPTTPDGNAVNLLKDLQGELESAKTELASVTVAAAESRSALEAEMQARAEAFEGELQRRRSAEADFEIWRAQAQSEGQALFARCTEQEAIIVSLRGQIEQASQRPLEQADTGCQDELMELDKKGEILRSEETETRPEAMDEPAPAEPGSPMDVAESTMTKCPESGACEDHESSEQKLSVAVLESQDQESDADDEAPGPGPFVPPPWQVVKRLSHGDDPYRLLGESGIRTEILELARRLKQEFENWVVIKAMHSFRGTMEYLVGTLRDLLKGWSTLVSHRRQLFESLLRETMLLETIQSILNFGWRSSIVGDPLAELLMETRNRAAIVWDWAPRQPVGETLRPPPPPIPNFAPVATPLPSVSAKRDRSPSNDDGRRRKR